MIRGKKHNSINIYFYIDIVQVFLLCLQALVYLLAHSGKTFEEFLFLFQATGTM